MRPPDGDRGLTGLVVDVDTDGSPTLREIVAVVANLGIDPVWYVLDFDFEAAADEEVMPRVVKSIGPVQLSSKELGDLAASILQTVDCNIAGFTAPLSADALNVLESANYGGSTPTVALLCYDVDVWEVVGPRALTRELANRYPRARPTPVDEILSRA